MNDMDQSIMQIVDALGGVQNILTMILSSNDIKLTEDQIAKLDNIINTQHRISTSQTDAENVDNNNPEWTYTFDTHDTKLHDVFGDVKGQKIMDIVHSNKFVIPVLIMTAFAYMMNYWFSLKYIIIKNVIQEIVGIIAIVSAILFLMAANKTSIAMLLRRFEFWFKFFYLAQWMIISCIYYYVLIDSREWKPYPVQSGSIEYDLELFTLSLGYITTILGCTVIAAFDAFHISTTIKAIYATCGALITTTAAISFTFYPDVRFEEEYFHISFTSLIAGSAQVLAIFFWRQAILSVLRKNRCVLIQYSPYIKWKSDNEPQLPQQVKMQSQIYYDNGLPTDGQTKLQLVATNSNVGERKPDPEDIDLSADISDSI